MEKDCHLQIHVETEDPQEILSVKDQKSPKWPQTIDACISVYTALGVCTHGRVNNQQVTYCRVSRLLC